MASDFAGVKLVVADLDGTLAESKTAIDAEMAGLILELLKERALAVISGGSYTQFQNELLPDLKGNSDCLSRLYLFPTCSSSMYIMKNGEWGKVYGDRIGEDAKTKILGAFKNALRDSGFRMPNQQYGELIEDREAQITFSALGQRAPLELKKVWDPDCKKRKGIIMFLKEYLPDGFEAKIGGTTSIDITRTGIDKGYGIGKIKENLRYDTDEMIFLGDKLEEGGNDYPVRATGVRCISVGGPADTKMILRRIMASKTV